MKKLMDILAYGYSVLMYPLWMPTYLMALYYVLFKHLVLPVPTAYACLWIGGTCFFTCIVPFLLLVVLKWMGKIKDFDVSDAKERLVPYIYSIICYGFWSAFLRLCQMPDFIVNSAICTCVILAVVALITLWWKISAHLASFGGAIGMVFCMLLYFGMDSVGSICAMLGLAWLLMLARIQLKAHSPLQTVAGFMLGLTAMLAANYEMIYTILTTNIQP